MDLKAHIDKSFLAELGYKDLSPEKEQQLITDLSMILSSRVSKRVAASIAEEDYEAFVKLEESGDNDAIEQWIDEKVPNQQEIIDDERQQMVEELKTGQKRVVEITSELLSHEDEE